MVIVVFQAFFHKKKKKKKNVLKTLEIKIRKEGVNIN